jgi:predicted phosphodiesterase
MAKHKENNLDEAKYYKSLKASGLGYAQIGEMVKKTADAVRAIIRKYPDADTTPREFQRIELGAPLELVGDAIVVGDVHVPATDWDFAGLVARVAERMSINRLVVAGDFFNHDLYSRFPHIVSPPTWAEERQAGKRLLEDWLVTFDEIVLLMGNHERMKQKAVNGNVDELDIFGCLSTSSKIKTSNYGYCWMDSGERRWRISHGREYSVNQLTVGAELALKHECHVISHHQHHAAIGRDRYKRYVVVDNGALVDPQKLAYAVMDENKCPNMARAFTALRRGYPYMFDRDGITDWTFWFN